MRRKLYNDKGYWKAQFKKLDVRVQQILNFERSGAIDVPVTDYMLQGHETVKLGLTGEKLLTRMVKAGMGDEPVAEMRNLINMVEVFSRRLKEVAESKWGVEIEHFPVFKSSTATVGELLEQTKAIREMNDFLEEE